MPGYDLSRFVNISETETSELTCSICQGILCCPLLVTKCCLQAFCEDCINNWLKTNNTCPIDSKTLTTNELFRPSRAFTNMLGKLEICCEYKECKEVLFLADLTQHTVDCCYNPENRVIKCENCLCVYPDKSSHDCIKALLELNKKANRKIEAQNIREHTLLSKIRELESEKENFFKTIQDLSQNNIASSSELTPLRNPTDSKLKIPSSFEISDQEIINRAREHMCNPKIIQNFMDQDNKDKVITIVRDQLKEFNSLLEICKSITDKLEYEFGYNWNCLASHQKSMISRCRYESGHLISLQFSELNIKIFKTKNFFYPNLRQRLINNKIKREIQIIETDMKQNMISEVQKFIFEAIEKCDTLNSVSSELQTQMEKSYPENWHLFCFAHFGTFSIRKIPETYINFKIENLDITLFQGCTRGKIIKISPNKEETLCTIPPISSLKPRTLCMPDLIADD